VRYNIFVRGKVNREAKVNTRLNRPEFSQIKYIPKTPENSYGSNYATQEVSSEIALSDIPNLRAATFKQAIRQSYPEKEVIILDGSVSDAPRLSNNNLSLTLFVKWR